MMEIGKSYKIFYDEGNLNNKTIHVLAVVDDNMIVYKYWRRHKMTWNYTVEHISYFDLLETHRYLKEIKT